MSLQEAIFASKIAIRNMVAFAEYFIEHESMSKDKWFEIQKEVLRKFVEEEERR